jgi:alkanesulfonate monooxygenase SsuD/methylene tetrahydromethanopterin reductase-like flavin-dependent oxidoreductase (luciferase family)
MEFGSFMEFHRRPDTPESQAFAEAFDHVDMCEELGLDAVWLAESHFSPERSVLSAPLILAAAIAGRTRRLKVGTAVLLLPLGNPLRLAEEVATLDHASQGRLEFGIGRSSVPGSYEGYGIDYTESRERFQECLEIMVLAWTQDRFSYNGKYFSYSDVRLVPRPLQAPHPLIRVAATTDDTFPLLGATGFPIFVGLRTYGLSRVRQQVNSYVNAWHAAGHAGEPDVSLRLPVYVAETRERALSEPEASFMRQFRRLGSQLERAATAVGADERANRTERAEQLTALTWDDVLEEKVAVGTPDMVAERLSRMRDELSLTGVVAEFNAGEQLSPQLIGQSLRLFCKEVAV